MKLDTDDLQFENCTTFDGSMAYAQNKVHTYTVEPPNKGHFGTGNFVLCREVVLFSEVQIVLAL